MSEHLGYIDSYFNKELSPEERRIFDLRIEQDPAFAEEVAFYLNTLNTAKAELATEKKERFREIYQEIRPAQKPGLVRRFWPYVSAAAVTIALIFRFVIFSGAVTPLKLADSYIEEKLLLLGVPMGNNTDSLHKGVEYYNTGKMKEALQIFEYISNTDSTVLAIEAKKMAGLVYLRTNDYDKALLSFKQVENDTTLHVNHGKFYHALVLMKRNQPGDPEEARRLLNEVIDKNLPGKETAETWHW